MSFSLQQKANGILIGEFSLFPKEKIVHGISTRLGGVSTFPYASLNLALHVGDRKENVFKNRKRFFEALSVPLERMCTSVQVHQTEVKIVDEKDRGRGAFSLEDALQGVDALVTREKNLPLILFFADCVPLLAYDTKNEVIAVAHAGWRGTLGEIGRKTLQVMKDAFGTAKSNCLFAIGPAIGSEDYVVSKEMVNDFKNTFSKAWQEQYIFQNEAQEFFLDLPRLNFLQLLDCGVRQENIACAHTSTFQNETIFFSHRKMQSLTGRMGALILLK